MPQKRNLQVIKNVKIFIIVNGITVYQYSDLRLLVEIYKFLKGFGIMSKIAVVYWSGTGNTEVMANAVSDGAKSKGAEVSVFTASEFKSSMMNDYDAIAFGCPAMGSEVLEEDEFEPMFLSCENELGGKKIALFGSYGWGDGEWMRDWEERCRNNGAEFACDFVICNDAPDDETVILCKSLGEALV